MDERHLLNELMKVVAAEAHEFVVRSRIPGLKKFAASAYVAEFFWYRYTGHAPGSAALNNPYLLFLRTPDARERALLTLNPETSTRKPLPGMRPELGHV
ncbi:hypothetical protein [Streptomyces olivaceus]|uniref:hypothetical protein n=1 Tax=Streptomyces olivaceus TaxID=47716 RepID=UPI0022EF3920|nr:hypothetical protein [Streptomyces olivaceus]GHI92010.1 hypothetical protein TPA0905_14810 [Streptomyces olivaceus]